MKKEEIVKLVKPYENNPYKAEAVLIKLLDSGEVNIREVELAIGDESEAYPHGFPELYGGMVDGVITIVNPDFTARYIAHDEARKGESCFAL